MSFSSCRLAVVNIWKRLCSHCTPTAKYPLATWWKYHKQLQPRMTEIKIMPARQEAIVCMLGNPEALKMCVCIHVNVGCESTHVFSFKTHGVICTVGHVRLAGCSNGDTLCCGNIKNVLWGFCYFLIHKCSCLHLVLMILIGLTPPPPHFVCRLGVKSMKELCGKQPVGALMKVTLLPYREVKLLHLAITTWGHTACVALEMTVR